MREGTSMNEKKESVLYKELNVGFVYVFVLIVGFIIVFSMITFLKNKVNEITEGTVASSNY